jgi:hypothetical protein
MARPAIDHRRATAERNPEAILDATERLLATHAPVSISAVPKTEAGLSSPTVQRAGERGARGRRPDARGA